PPDAGNTYSAGNGSIAGNKPHNPFLFESATFTITGAGITADTTITSATFSFGTTRGVDVPGVIVPEPSSLVLCLSGVGLAGMFGIFRQWRGRGAVSAGERSPELGGRGPCGAAHPVKPGSARASPSEDTPLRNRLGGHPWFRADTASRESCGAAALGQKRSPRLAAPHFGSRS